MSESSEFERLEDRLKIIGAQGSSRAKELRSRYWAARRKKKLARQAVRAAEPPETEDDMAYALEVMCGSGRLASALAKEGFVAVGFDHSGNKDSPSCR
eukprot:4809507-Karenia_brevis.AAC.1